MKALVALMVCGFTLSGCVAETMAQGLSMKGKHLSYVKQRYGPPTSDKTGPDGVEYVWDHPQPAGDCTMTVMTDATDRVTDVKMVGQVHDCLRLRKRGSQLGRPAL